MYGRFFADAFVEGPYYAGKKLEETPTQISDKFENGTHEENGQCFSGSLF